MLHPLVDLALGRTGILHEVLPCDPSLADTAAFCAHYGVDPADSANTILIVSKRPTGHTAACVALATTRLDVNRRVCAAMSVKKASFAPADATVELSGMEIGGVTPFGLASDIPVLIDAAVMSRPSIVLGGGNRTSKLRVDPAMLLEVPGARIVEDLAVPIEG